MIPNKYIDIQCILVLFFPVFANQNPPASTSLATVVFRLPHSNHHDEKPVTAIPLVPADYKCLLAQLLFLHILTNAPGVWGSAFPFLKFHFTFSPLAALFPRFFLSLHKNRPDFRPLFSKACALFHFPYPVSPLLATLTRTAGCIPTIPILELSRPFDIPMFPPWLACPQNVCEDYGFRSNLWSETFTTSSISTIHTIRWTTPGRFLRRGISTRPSLGWSRTTCSRRPGRSSDV